MKSCCCSATPSISSIICEGEAEHILRGMLPCLDRVLAHKGGVLTLNLRVPH